MMSCCAETDGSASLCLLQRARSNGREAWTAGRRRAGVRSAIRRACCVVAVTGALWGGVAVAAEKEAISVPAQTAPDVS